MPAPIPDDTRSAIVADLAAGTRRQIVAANHGVSYSAVAKIDTDRLAGFVRTDRARKLTPEQRDALVLDYREGMLSGTEMAQKYGVSTSTVTAIAKDAGVGRHGGRRASESPLELVAGAWLYDSKGVAHWTPGAEPQGETA